MTTESKATGRRRLLHPAIWLALALPIFAWAQLTYPGYLELHSAFLPIFNLNSLMRHLSDLTWAPVIGQPYDLLRGERELPYLLAAIPRLLGASAPAAVKWTFGASILAGALGMFGWAKGRLGAWPALLASIAYALWPIALATVYVRGAFAEAVLLGLMPWVLWAADAAVQPGRLAAAVGLALGLAAMLWTQMGLALWFAGLALVYIVLLGRPWRRERPVAQPAGGQPGTTTAVTALLGWLGGLILGLLGLLPLILDRGLGGTARVTFEDHFVYPHQLMSAGWGTGPSISGPYDTLTFQLGLIACGLALFAAFARRPTAMPFAEATAHPEQLDTVPASNTLHAPGITQYVSAGCVFLLVFLSTTLSVPIWRLLPVLTRTLTYPWQLLLLAGPWLAWLAGLGGRVLLGLLPEEHRSAGSVPLCAGLIALTVLASYPYLAPATINTPVPDAPAAIFGDGEIALLSAVATGVPGPSGQITALARWQALRPLDRDYTVFFHVVGPDGAIWGQQDIMPQAGALPTTQWQPGQVVPDQYQVILKPDAPAGEGYTYQLGLYDWQTGARLRTETDDKVVLKP